METPIKDSIFRHYKGGVYQIIDIATHTETLEEVVVYKSLIYNTVWVRPLNIWNQKVELNGEIVNRFESVKDLKGLDFITSLLGLPISNYEIRDYLDYGDWYREPSKYLENKDYLFCKSIENPNSKDEDLYIGDVILHKDFGNISYFYCWDDVKDYYYIVLMDLRKKKNGQT